MRRALIFIVLGVSSCVPGIGGGCQSRIAEKVVEKAVESSVSKEGGKLDLNFGSVPKEVRGLLPPGYEVKVSVRDEKEGGYFVAGVVRNTTQQKLEEFYTKKLGQPDLRSTTGSQLLLHWKEEGVGVAINGKSGSIEVIITRRAGTI